MGSIKMEIGLGLWHHGRYVEHGLTKYALWPACLPHQLLQQLAYYAQDIAPYFERRAVPMVTP